MKIKEVDLKQINLVRKSVARLMAIQIIYQFNFHNKEKALEEIKENTISKYTLTHENNLKSYKQKIDKKLLNLILDNYLNYINEAEKNIKENTKKAADFDDVAMNILYCARIENKSNPTLAKNIIIKEYTDISNSFHQDSRKIAFINGVLDKIIK
jgi:transcription termination factor NusB